MSIFDTLNIPISEGGANPSHMHDPTKSQSYQGLNFLLSDTKFMNTCSFTIDFKKMNVCHMPANE